MSAIDRPAFYTLRSGGWRDYATILHLPYTVWHLSYVAIGAAAAPGFSVPTLGWALLAFFLATGISAHAIDELNSRPLRTAIPSWVLLTLGVVPLVCAAAIGIGGALIVPLLWPLVLSGPFFVAAYNREWFSGRLHNRFWFAALWGAFPVTAGYIANAPDVTAQGLITMGWIAAGAAFLSDAQRVISNRTKFLRRKARRLEVSADLVPGTDSAERRAVLDKAWLLQPLDGALRQISFAVPLVAAGLVMSRVAG
ncbi:MAG: hypothetical protein WD208_05905 [Dehalococcoidia bacterium]